MARVHGLDELVRRVLDRDLCSACGACVGGCPYMTVHKGKAVKLHDCTVEQGRCYAYCPMTFFDPDPVSRHLFGVPPDEGPLGYVADVVAARASDPELAQRGQGGGTVTAFLQYAFHGLLIDSAVVTGVDPEDGYPRGVVVTSAEEAAQCAGSRYVGSHSLAAVREALDRGFERIAVVGVPCQVRAVRKMVLHDLKKENLEYRIRMVIGLFCTWAFSSRDFNEFMSKRFGGKEIVKTDIPPPPANVLEVETADGLESVPLEELRPLIQAACNICPDMTAEFADISVGMYEGRPGWNTVITRSATGSSLLEAAMDRGWLEIDVFPEDNLKRLEAASLQKRERAAKASC